MARYIDANMLQERCDRFLDLAGDTAIHLEDAINGTPTADVAPVIHARWIRASNKPYVDAGLKCSHCKARISYSESLGGNHLYCYKCGARMDEREET